MRIKLRLRRASYKDDGIRERQRERETLFAQLKAVIDVLE